MIAPRFGVLSRLRKTHLGFGQREFTPPFSPSRPGGFEAGDGALADQFPFKFCQGCKDAEYQPPCSGGGVDLRSLALYARRGSKRQDFHENSVVRLMRSIVATPTLKWRAMARMDWSSLSMALT